MLIPSPPPPPPPPPVYEPTIPRPPGSLPYRGAALDSVATSYTRSRERTQVRTPTRLLSPRSHICTYTGTHARSSTFTHTTQHQLRRTLRPPWPHGSSSHVHACPFHPPPNNLRTSMLFHTVRHPVYESRAHPSHTGVGAEGVRGARPSAAASSQRRMRIPSAQIRGECDVRVRAL